MTSSIRLTLMTWASVNPRYPCAYISSPRQMAAIAPTLTHTVAIFNQLSYYFQSVMLHGFAAIPIPSKCF